MKNKIAVFAMIFMLTFSFISCSSTRPPDSFSDNKFVYNYISSSTLSISCNYLNTDESIVLPHTLPDKDEKVVMVASKGFKKFETMKNLTISEGYETIENEAFAECVNLELAIIPSSVTKIRTGAFKDCTKLTSVYVFAETPPILIGDIFTLSAAEEEEEIIRLTIYIPHASYEFYSEAGVWKNYTDFFVEMPPDVEA